ALAAEDQYAPLDFDMELVTGDAGQGGDHPEMLGGFVDIHRRLPTPVGRGTGLLYRARHALGALEHAQRLRPHPLFQIAQWHRIVLWKFASQHYPLATVGAVVGERKSRAGLQDPGACASLMPGCRRSLCQRVIGPGARPLVNRVAPPLETCTNTPTVIPGRLRYSWTVGSGSPRMPPDYQLIGAQRPATWEHSGSEMKRNFISLFCSPNFPSRACRHPARRFSPRSIPSAAWPAGRPRL